MSAELPNCLGNVKTVPKRDERWGEAGALPRFEEALAAEAMFVWASVLPMTVKGASLAAAV